MIAVPANPTNQVGELQLLEMQRPARSLGLKLIVLKASTERELDTAFATLAQQGVGALLVVNDPCFPSRRELLVALAARHAIPASYSDRADTVAGGLMSYGASLADFVPSGWRLRWPDSQGREARRTADHAANAISDGHQPQDGEDTRT